MNELKIFNFESNEVRTQLIKDEPWFVGKDVAEILGYKDSVNAIKQHVDIEDKMKGSQNTTPSIIDSLGRKQFPTFINESGMYALVFGSKLENATKFKRWVTSEVLPSIRKTGSYQSPASYMIADPIARAKQWIEEQKQTQMLIEKTAIQEQLIAEYEPKITYLDEILNSKNTMAITQIAADYGMSGQELNKILWNHDVQRKVGGQWVLYKKHMNNGFTKSKTFTNDTGAYPRTKWTQKGRLFIHNLLESLGHAALVDEQIEIEV